MPRLDRHDRRRSDGGDPLNGFEPDPDDHEFDHPPPRARRTRRDRDADPDDGRAQSPRPRPRPRHRADGRESFKCGRCRAFVGPTVSGGRHRNHCPLCLTSRHVDARRPGDRASTCRALMAPVGTFFRVKGEQALLHRCGGCGLERHNRVAADDNPLALLRLPPVPARVGAGTGLPVEQEEQEQTA